MFRLLFSSAVPLACYLATASGYGYWLDSGEFTATAVTLGIAHPPGHPFAQVVHHVACVLPLGPLPFRVALACSVLTALASGFLCEAAYRTLRGFVRSQAVAGSLAVAAAWSAAAAYGWWFQAVRPEVYALQTLLSAVVLERLTRVEWESAHAWSTRSQALYHAGLAFGLGLANHHFLALLVLPAAAPTFARATVRAGVRVGSKAWVLSALAVAVGLCAYVYLPARAATNPFVNFGDPDTAAKFWWVVSAEAFQGNVGAAVPQPLGERLADVGVQLVEGLTVWAALLALVGIYFMFRVRSVRRFAWLWGMTFVVFAMARVWLGFIRSNPDAAGYLAPATGAMAVCAAAAVAFAFEILMRLSTWRFVPRALTVMSVLAALIAAAQFPRGLERNSLASFRATDVFDEPLRRAVPYKSVILLHDPQTVFRFLGGEATERIRPDVTVVPMPFLPYPGMVQDLVGRHPELRELLRGYRLDGELRQPDLQSLANQRPLLIEMDPRVPAELFESLVPNGLYYEVLPFGATSADEQAGARTQWRAYAELDKGLFEPDYRDPETRHRLLWRHYNDAIYYAGFGDFAHARRAAAEGLRYNAEARELRALAEVLEGREGRGPLDVSPFRVR